MDLTGKMKRGIKRQYEMHKVYEKENGENGENESI